MLRFTVLASGSRGNCAYLETPGARVLIDAGLSCRQIEERLSSIGRSLGDLQAIFVTHEHSDHVCGLPVLLKRHLLPVYCTPPTAKFLAREAPAPTRWATFRAGDTVTHGDLAVDTFAVPHDAYDPVGFLLRHELGAIGFLTDLGYATRLVIERVRQARALVLEANHDLRLLQNDTKRPWSVKQRILSRHGHLSNDAAAEVAAQIVTPRLEDIFLGHLSSDCNAPALAREAVQRRLLLAGHHHVRLHETAPDKPCATLEWSAPLAASHDNMMAPELAHGGASAANVGLAAVGETRTGVETHGEIAFFSDDELKEVTTPRPTSLQEDALDAAVTPSQGTSTTLSSASPAPTSVAVNSSDLAGDVQQVLFD